MKKYIPTTTFDSTDSCSDGLNAKYCTPPFEDITRVLKKKFEASQTCGIEQSERYCKKENEKWSCKFCDSSQTAQMLPTRHLNDHEKTTDEETCWYSGSVIDQGQQAQIRSEVTFGLLWQIVLRNGQNKNWQFSLFFFYIFFDTFEKFLIIFDKFLPFDIWNFLHFLHLTF